MKRAIAAFLILLVLAGAAHAFGLGLGNRFGKLGTFPGTGGGAPAPPLSGALLLEDGTSILLLEGGAGNLCLEGGC